MSVDKYDTGGWMDIDIELYDLIVSMESDVMKLAGAIIDRYWAKLDSSNRTIINNRKVGIDPKKNLAVVAPVMESTKSTSRTYQRIVWCVYGAKGYQRVNKRAGKRIPFSKGFYESTYTPASILRHAVGWDARLILAAEDELELLRLTLKGYQRIIVSIAAKYRRINRLSEKREITYGEK